MNSTRRRSFIVKIDADTWKKWGLENSATRRKVAISALYLGYMDFVIDRLLSTANGQDKWESVMTTATDLGLDFDFDKVIL